MHSRITTPQPTLQPLTNQGLSKGGTTSSDTRLSSAAGPPMTADTNEYSPNAGRGTASRQGRACRGQRAGLESAGRKIDCWQQPCMCTPCQARSACPASRGKVPPAHPAPQPGASKEAGLGRGSRFRACAAAPLTKDWCAGGMQKRDRRGIAFWEGAGCERVAKRALAASLAPINEAGAACAMLLSRSACSGQPHASSIASAHNSTQHGDACRRARTLVP